MINKKGFAVHTIILILASIILTFTKLSFLESLRISFGSFYVLFLPGFILTYVFFKELDIIERIALSFALSIAIVPLIVFYLNKDQVLKCSYRHQESLHRLLPGVDRCLDNNFF